MPDDTIHKRDSYLNQLQLIAIATAFIMGITIQVGLTIFPPIALSVLVASALTTSGYMMYKFYRQNSNLYKNISKLQHATIETQNKNVTPKIALGVGMMAFAILLASGAIFTPILGTVSILVLFAVGLTQVLKTGLQYYANQLAYANNPRATWAERIHLHYDAQHTLSIGSATSAIFMLSLSLLASGLIGIPIIIPTAVLIAGAAFSGVTFGMSIVAIYKQEQQISRLIPKDESTTQRVLLARIQNRQSSRIAASTTALIIISIGIMILPVSLPLTMLAIIGGAAVVAIIGNVISWSATQKKLLLASSTPDVLSLEQQQITLQNVKTASAVISGLLMVVTIVGMATPILPMVSMLISGTVALLAFTALQIADRLSQRNAAKIAAIKDPDAAPQKQSIISAVEIAKLSALLVTGIIMLLMIPNTAVPFISPAAMIAIATISFLSFATVNIADEIRHYMSQKEQKDAPIDKLRVLKNIALLISAAIMLISLPSMAVGFLPAPAMLTFSIISFIAYITINLISEYKARSIGTAPSQKNDLAIRTAGQPTTAQSIPHAPEKKTKTSDPYKSRPLPATPSPNERGNTRSSKHS